MFAEKISQDVYRARRAKFLTQMGKGVAVLFAAPHAIRNADTHYSYRTDSSFHYLTGFTEPDAVAIFAPETDKPYRLFVPPKDPVRELWDGKRLGVDGAMAELKPDACYAVAEFDREFQQVIKRAGRVYYPLGQFPEIDARVLPVIQNFRARVRDGEKPIHWLGNTQSIIGELRKKKDSSEVALMRVNCKNSALAHVAAMKFTRPGQFEFQVEAEINRAFIAGGAEALAYGSIVAGGANATVLHYVANRAPLNDGELLLIDAGGEMGLYASDITRTFPINGKFTAPQRRIYDLVLKAQLAAIEQAVVGKPYTAMHDASVAVLTQGLVDLGLLAGPWEERVRDRSYGKFFPHGTGHWIGKDVHDSGCYYDDNGDSILLEAGQMMTVEPGLYFNATDSSIPEEYRGIGVRIEDDVLITKDGPEILTADVPKRADEIESLMRR